MSNSALKWAWGVPAEHPTLSPGACHVLLALADRFNDRKGFAWPDYADIQRRTNLSSASIKRKLAELEESGLIERQPRLDPSGRKVGTLFLLLRPAEEAEEVQEVAPAFEPESPREVEKRLSREEGELARLGLGREWLGAAPDIAHKLSLKGVPATEFWERKDEPGWLWAALSSRAAEGSA
ncbi:helix-turn-helix domain-containing protein [Agromyces indicus]|uniref:Helix-turn-helix domain-containing protein n=1 Tax=Agromyces indicus TaxID=758919 RepID=A0ABU1FKU1_9MICO|nr:helix-turn-helix domain-containing protein [Agromyces indicus]MDR5691905.1 helix-turn-helix domain-containing protein [Agromyces indicus]